MISKIPHQLYYLIEMLFLIGGFMLVSMVSNFNIKVLGMGLVLVLYALIGIFHHKLHHNLKGKVMVEYILVSAVIFAIFLFLNIYKF